jgi:hypothetical protein
MGVFAKRTAGIFAKVTVEITAEIDCQDNDQGA